MSSNVLRDFTPQAIANLELWLDASDFSTLKPLNISNGNTVSEWRDKSGNGNHAVQGTAVNQPAYTPNILNGKSVIRNDDAKWLISPASLDPDTNPDITLFTVYSWRVDQNIESLYGNGQAWDRGIVLRWDSFGLDGAIIQGPGNPGTDYPELQVVGSFRILTHQMDFLATDGSGAWINGTKFATYTEPVGANGGSDNIYIGSYGAASGGGPSKTDIVEMIMYNRILTSSERQQIEQYLVNKWKITI